MKTAIALGNFDGVHTAHKKIIENAVRYAENKGITSLVYMFETHPRIVLGDSGFGIITDNSQKSSIIKRLGADKIYFEETTPQFLSVPPEDFAKDVLKGRFGAEYVCVGYNYRFGKNGAGDAQMLSELGKRYGFDVEICDRITADGQDISSSLLRQLIKTGDMEKANSLMQEPFGFKGKVTRGKRLGKELDAATANVEIPKNLIVPRNGVYITKTVIDGKAYKSVTNIGTNPTVEHAKPRSETHIIGFSGDLYGKSIEIYFYKFVRGEIKFASVEKLREQIQRDIAFAGKYCYPERILFEQKNVDKNK